MRDIFEEEKSKKEVNEMIVQYYKCAVEEREDYLIELCGDADIVLTLVQLLNDADQLIAVHAKLIEHINAAEIETLLEFNLRARAKHAREFIAPRIPRDKTETSAG